VLFAGHSIRACVCMRVCACVCRNSLTSSKEQKKSTEVVNLDRQPRRNIETLTVCTGVDLGKPKLKLGKNVKGNRKGFYEYIRGIKNTKENLSPRAQWGRGSTDKKQRQGWAA